MSMDTEQRELKIFILPDFHKKPGTFKLRQRFVRLSAKLLELEELSKKDDSKAKQEMANLFLEYDSLLEHVLRTACHVENGTIEEALGNLSAEEADTLFQQVFGIGGNTRFFESASNGTTPEVS